MVIFETAEPSQLHNLNLRNHSGRRNLLAVAPHFSHSRDCAELPVARCSIGSSFRIAGKGEREESRSELI